MLTQERINFGISQISFSNVNSRTLLLTHEDQRTCSSLTNSNEVPSTVILIQNNPFFPHLCLRKYLQNVMMKILGILNIVQLGKYWIINSSVNGWMEPEWPWGSWITIWESLCVHCVRENLPICFPEMKRDRG